MPTKKINKRSAVKTGKTGKTGKAKPKFGMVDMTGRWRGSTGVNPRFIKGNAGADMAGGNQPRKPGSAWKKKKKGSSKS